MIQQAMHQLWSKAAHFLGQMCKEEHFIENVSRRIVSCIFCFIYFLLFLRCKWKIFSKSLMKTTGNWIIAIYSKLHRIIIADHFSKSIVRNMSVSQTAQIYAPLFALRDFLSSVMRCILIMSLFCPGKRSLQLIFPHQIHIFISSDWTLYCICPSCSPTLLSDN